MEDLDTLLNELAEDISKEDGVTVEPFSSYPLCLSVMLEDVYSLKEVARRHLGVRGGYLSMQAFEGRQKGLERLLRILGNALCNSFFVFSIYSNPLIYKLNDDGTADIKEIPDYDIKDDDGWQGPKLISTSDNGFTFQTGRKNMGWLFFKKPGNKHRFMDLLETVYNLFVIYNCYLELKDNQTKEIIWNNDDFKACFEKITNSNILPSGGLRRCSLCMEKIENFYVT